MIEEKNYVVVEVVEMVNVVDQIYTLVSIIALKN